MLLITPNVWSSASKDKITITYPKLSREADPRTAFPLAVLELIMKKSAVNFEIVPSNIIMERSRALVELENANSINIFWTSMGSHVEAKLRPIHIPIFRGLIGHRIFIIHKSRQIDFNKIKNLSDLKKLTALQGIGWIDEKILKDAGLNVETAPYDSLFKMIQTKRSDYFPRGIIEAYPEIEKNKQQSPDLVVENKLMLVYKSDMIFYTNKKNTKLANLIEKGFKQIYQDGSYMKLFNTHPYIQDALKRIKMNNRTIIRIENPYLSEEDRAIPEVYWMPKS